MQLSDYFDFEAFDTPFGRGERIRLKGHRINLEHVLSRVDQGQSVEAIVREVYPSLSQEQVRACVDFREQEPARVASYLAETERIGEAYYQEWLKKPNPLRDKLQAARAAQEVERTS